jgi:hypothetical protein
MDMGREAAPEGLIFPTKEAERGFAALPQKEQEEILMDSWLARQKKRGERAKKERGPLGTTVEVIAQGGKMFDNMYDHMLAGETLLRKKLKTALSFGDRYEKALAEEQKARQDIIKWIDKIDKVYQGKLAASGIQTSVTESIDSGNLDELPEAIGYNVAMAAGQIIPTLLTGGYSMYAQTLPDAYKAGVEEIAKKTKRTPEQVIADGDDAFVVANLSAGVQGALERVSGGLVSKSIASKGGYKWLRDYVIDKTGKKSWSRAAGVTTALGGQLQKEGIIETSQELVGVAGEQLAASDSAEDFYNNLNEALSNPETKKRIRESYYGGIAGAGGLIIGGKTLAKGWKSLSDYRRERNQAVKEAAAQEAAAAPVATPPPLPTPPAAPVPPPPPPPATEAEVVYEPVTQEEYEKYVDTGVLDEERQAGVDEDVALIQKGEKTIDDIEDPLYKQIVADQLPEMEVEVEPVEEAPAAAEEVVPQPKEGNFVVVNGEKGVYRTESNGQKVVETPTKIYELDERGIEGIGGRLLGDKKLSVVTYKIDVIDEDTALVDGEEYQIIKDAKGNTIALKGNTRTIRTEPAMVEVDIKRQQTESPTTEELAPQIEQVAPEMTIDKQQMVHDLMGQNMTERVADLLDNGITKATTESDLLQAKLWAEATIADLLNRQKGNPYATDMIEQIQEFVNILYYEYYAKGGKRTAEGRGKTTEKAAVGPKGKERVSPKPAERKQPVAKQPAAPKPAPVTPPAAPKAEETKPEETKVEEAIPVKEAEKEVELEPKAAKKIAEITPQNLQVFKSIVSKDRYRPNMQGVYFDKKNQKIVATDAMNMVVIDADVKTDGIIDPKTGKTLEEKFPDYQAAVPTYYKKGVKDVSINELIEKLNGIIGTPQSKDQPIIATIGFDGEKIGMSPKLLKAGLKVLKDLGYGTARLEYESPNKPLLVKTADGKATLLTMPTLISEDIEPERVVSIGEYTTQDVSGKPKAEETKPAPKAPETKGAEEAKAEETKPTAESFANDLEKALNAMKVKVDKGAALEGTFMIPVLVYNGAIDAAILAVKAGKTVVDAINVAVKYVNDNLKSDWDNSGFIGKLSVDLTKPMESYEDYKRVKGKGKEPSPGQKVGVRFNLNIQDYGRRNVLSVHEKNYNGEVIDIVKSSTVSDVKFSASKSGASKIKEGLSNKFPIASVDGSFVSSDADKTLTESGQRVFFNPRVADFFYDKDGREVLSASKATLDGSKVFADGLEYGERVAPINQQPATKTTTQAEFTSKQEGNAATEFDGMKKPSKIKMKTFDGKHGKGAFNRMQNITQNFEDIMDGLSEKIKQDCL